MVREEKEVRKTEKEERYSIGEVATQTEPVIIDGQENDEEGNPKRYNIFTALKKIMNDIDDLKDGLL